MTETMGLHIGEITRLIILLGVLAVIVAIIVFIIRKLTKRSNNRADRRLALERESTVLLQKRVDDLNERVIVIEKMLREVE